MDELSKHFEIVEVVDMNENSIFSLVNQDLENKATVLIKDCEITMFFEDGSPEESFESDYEAMLKRVNELGYKFIKLQNPNRRWHVYNPNPKERNTADCTLRAYCAAFDIDWDEAYDIASEVAKSEGYLLNASNMVKKILTEHFGCDVDPKYNTKTVKRNDRSTVAEFAMTHPYGTYILHVPSHLVTVKNGEYWDSWDSGEKKVDTVYNVM